VTDKVLTLLVKNISKYKLKSSNCLKKQLIVEKNDYKY